MLVNRASTVVYTYSLNTTHWNVFKYISNIQIYQSVHKTFLSIINFNIFHPENLGKICATVCSMSDT